MSLATTPSVRLHWNDPGGQIVWEFDDHQIAMKDALHRRGIAAMLNKLPQVARVYYDFEHISFMLTEAVANGDYQAAISEIKKMINDYLSAIA